MQNFRESWRGSHMARDNIPQPLLPRLLAESRRPPRPTPMSSPLTHVPAVWDSVPVCSWVCVSASGTPPCRIASSPPAIPAPLPSPLWQNPSSGAPAHQDRSPCDDALACGSGWGVLRASLMESRSSPGNPPPTGPKSTDKAGSVLLMTHWVLPAPAPLNVQRLGPGRERDRSPELQGLRAPSPAL